MFSPCQRGFPPGAPTCSPCVSVGFLQVLQLPPTVQRHAGTGSPTMTPPSSSPLAPPPSGVAPPPLHPARPPLGCVVTPPPPMGPMRSQREADSSQSESEPDVEGVVLVLTRALAACRHTVKDQVCNDVAKRLRLLEDSWRSGRLSQPVRRRMHTLSLELQSGHWDSADEIHRSLMVDHVTEVSQWMVGVKRLIAETRKLSPELLEPLQKGPVQDPAEPVQDPVVPVQDPAEPVQDPVVPVQDPVVPVQDPAEPVQDPAEPVQDPVVPVQDPAEPVQDPVVPVQDPVVPVQDPAEPVQDPVVPVQDPAEPAQDC
ncbi:steroid receptor RNA activator 1 isoform X6 [Epinephelus fuscoguttatus]|nr:steroid receptor RNA activator 1 isoform X4 [Epinephelus fuscoguttatus]XP_049448633.1 steroid receptor RNA activator 1 isoform X6 [Epinephelus fuscoguttatus]